MRVVFKNSSKGPLNKCEVEPRNIILLWNFQYGHALSHHTIEIIGMPSDLFYSGKKPKQNFTWHFMLQREKR